ncbi:hypothetical protein GVAV_001280 [Gurleya vavrai]
MKYKRSNRKPNHRPAKQLRKVLNPIENNAYPYKKMPVTDQTLIGAIFDETKFNLQKDEMTVEETLSLINYVEDNYNENLCNAAFESIKNCKNLLISSYIFLKLVKKNDLLYNHENFILIIETISKLQDLEKNYEEEILVRTIKLIQKIFDEENGNLIIKNKAFYLFLPFLLKRKNYSKNVRISVYELLKKASENFKKDAFKDLLSEYMNFDVFKIEKLCFCDFIIIDFFFLAFDKYVDEVLLNSFLITLLSYTMEKETESIIMNLTSVCNNYLDKEKCLLFLVLFVNELINEQKLCISEYFACLGSIIDYYGNNYALTEIETFLYKKILKVKPNDFIRKIYIFLINYVKGKEEKKYYALKALTKLKSEQIKEDERKLIISMLVVDIEAQTFRSKECIIDILDNLGYTKLFTLLQNYADEESAQIRKKIFNKMKRCLYEKERVKDFVLMYLNFLTEPETRFFVVNDFNIDEIYKIGFLSDNNTYIINKENYLHEKDIYYCKQEFIQNLAKYFYFQEDKSIARYLNLEIKSYLSEVSNIYFSKILKNYSNYNTEEFEEYQIEIIEIINQNSENINIVNDYLAIIINLDKKNLINSHAKQKLVDVCHKYFTIENYVRKCGIIYRNLECKFERQSSIEMEILILGAIGSVQFRDYYKKYEIKNTYGDRGLIYFLDFHPEIARDYFNELRSLIQKVCNQDKIYNGHYGDQNLAEYQIIDKKEFAVDQKEVLPCKKADLRTIEFLKHLKKILKKDKDGNSDLSIYFTIVSVSQIHLLSLILSKNASISYYAFKLASYATFIGAILPQISLPYLMFFYSMYFNTSFKNTILLYDRDIISSLEIIIKRIVNIFMVEKLEIKNQNLCFVIVYKYLKSEKMKYKIIKKCFALFENESLLCCYFILKNFFYINFSKKETKMILDDLNEIIGHLELCINNDDYKRIILMHMCIRFRKMIKDRKYIEIEYGDLLYTTKYKESEKEYIKELKKEIISDK